MSTTESDEEKENAVDTVESLKRMLAEKNKQLADLTDKHNKELAEKDRMMAEMKSSTAAQGNAHSDAFWLKISSKLDRADSQYDPEYVKRLLTTGEVSVFDTDPYGESMLEIAAAYGSYDICQLCLNLGAKDVEKKASWVARRMEHPHVEQLLLFAALEGNVGDEVRQTADTMNKQRGIADIVIEQLQKEYKEKSSQHFIKEALCTIMSNIIEEKLAFSDDLLYLCLRFECEEDEHKDDEDEDEPQIAVSSSSNEDEDEHKDDHVNKIYKNITKTKLWQSIVKACKDVIENGSKRDWYWLKQFVLPSTVWCLASERDGKPHYLYYELLKLIDAKSAAQLHKLESDMDVLATKQKTAWQTLISWSMPTEYDVARQDAVPNCVAPKHTHKQLSEHGGSSLSFNAHTFYDLQEYLPQLVSLAHQVDEPFHKSVQSMFAVDGRTKEARLAVSNGGAMKYSRGPVKLVERAKSKASNDYFAEAFPTSACVLDLNRCAFVFNDIETLLFALNLFVNKVAHFQGGNIIGIVRNKNTFADFVLKADYADIKLNVLIKGKTNCIIGEVQFLLKAMKSFKDGAHNLYAIQRQKEYFDNTVSNVLPILLDEPKQLTIAASTGDANALSKALVVARKSHLEGLINERDVASLCANNHVKAVQLLVSMIPASMLLEHGIGWLRPAFRSCSFSAGETAKFLLSLLDVAAWKPEGKSDVLRVAFKHCDVPMIEHVINAICSSKEELNSLLKLDSCVTAAARNSRFDGVLQKLSSFFDLSEFSDLLINEDAVRTCVWVRNKALKYIFSIERVKKLYLVKDKENHDRIFVLFLLACETYGVEWFNFVLNELGLTVNDYVAYFMQYEMSGEESLPMRVIHDVEILKRVCELMDEQLVCSLLLQSDRKHNQNALEHAIEGNDQSMLSHILSYELVRKECVNTKDLLWRILYWLAKKADQEIIGLVRTALAFTDELVVQMQSHTVAETKGFGDEATRYWKKKLDDKKIAILIKNAKRDDGDGSDDDLMIAD